MVLDLIEWYHWNVYNSCISNQLLEVLWNLIWHTVKQELLSKLSKYLPSMKFDDYSFDHYQDMWTNATSSLYTYPPFRLSTNSELLKNNWLLKLRNSLFVLFTQLSLSYLHIRIKLKWIIIKLHIWLIFT